MEKLEGKKMIRKMLSFEIPKKSIRSECDFLEKEHHRFDMSGYEHEVGEVTTYNQMVLNKFAHLGIYDYTKFLFLDFHKGCGTLYFQYWNTNNVIEMDFCGLGTVEIIEEILNLTIYSGRAIKRRRSW